ncbi:MAG TPA: GNAT family N-acetyltransferase [Steroidobacteraceae bacterium]|nr:GNAT family N-acetyltransferase [Steroidobacteraceae bacterium]
MFDRNTTPLLVTSRARLRPFRMADVDLLFALDRDPEVMRHISKGAHTPREAIEQKILPGWLELYRAPRPHGFWAIELLSSGAFVGWVHLRPDRISAPELELGYRLARAVWGQGIATECARAVIDMAFAEGICDFVSARTLKKNVGSQRVMQKCGLSFREEFSYSLDLLPGWSEDERHAVKYGLSCQAWASGSISVPGT